MGFFVAAQGCGGGGKKVPLPKVCYTYPTMMKLDTVIPYVKKIQGVVHFDIKILILLTVLEFLKRFFMNMVTILNVS